MDLIKVYREKGLNKKGKLCGAELEVITADVIDFVLQTERVLSGKNLSSALKRFDGRGYFDNLRGSLCANQLVSCLSNPAIEKYVEEGRFNVIGINEAIKRLVKEKNGLGCRLSYTPEEEVPKSFSNTNVYYKTEELLNSYLGERITIGEKIILCTFDASGLFN